MKKIIIKSSIFLLLALLPNMLSAQTFQHERYLSFEEHEVPAFIKGKKSKLAISDAHFKDGKQSLKWDFKSGGELFFNKDVPFEVKDPSGVDTYLSSFVVWIYNEKPLDEKVEFQFLKDGKVCSHFTFGINFKGWRSAYISFERDMEGTPEVGMNAIKIVAPKTNGQLYIDQMVTAAKVDHRHHTADIQVPFVNKETTNHWLVVYKMSRLQPDIPLQSNVTESQKKDLKTIEDRFKSLIYSPAKLSKTQVEKIKNEFEAYNIVRNGDNIKGLPLFFTRAAEAFERLEPVWQKDVYIKKGMELQKYFNLMNRVATAYNNAKSNEDKTLLKNIFVDMYDHVTDQGVAYGSSMGNITHYGYSFRGMFTSYFLMKDVLIETGRLEAAQRTMQWYGVTNETYIKPTVNGIDMDSFNTIATGRISSILIMEDSPERVQYMQSFSRWINNGCLPAPGLDGAFKKDGGAFHHRNNYPAYAVGGLSGATDMIYLMNNTSFAVSELGHQTVKNVLQKMRFYCNTTYFPLSMSGRHPNGKGELIPIHYARLAMAGTPDRKEKIDRELASEFLRLVDVNDTEEKPEYMPKSRNKEQEALAEKFIAANIKAEENPNGNLALGYGCISVQRRNNWSAVVRGHSRYLWAAEHYLGANLYGRYLAHGSMQILTAPNGDRVNPASSGWVEDGFDWGRIPGATAIHLPVEELKANVLNVDVYSGFEEMLYSDEAFAGGLSQEQTNGNFGMKLHEHDKYNGSHRARKSYHFFDGRIVCLGSNIGNIVSKYNTETTVFQLAVTDEASRNYWKNYQMQPNFMVDHLGTGYFIPNIKDNDVNFEMNFPQKSRKQNTGEPTSGDWVNLTINHGKFPRGKGYEYMIVPQTTSETMKSFSEKAPYQVLQRDRNAHIVKDLETNTTSYVLFETPKSLPEGIIQKVDTTCLVMLKETNKELTLTVCDPDLALYRGESDELLDDEGKRVERSIYSRPWKGNESKEIPVTVTLKGKWNITGNANCKVLSSDNEKTILQYICKDGASFDTKLVR